MVDTDDTRRTIHDGRRTTPPVQHKLPTGELIIASYDGWGSYISIRSSLSQYVLQVYICKQGSYTCEFRKFHDFP